MIENPDRIRQAEQSAGVHDDLPWEVGDILAFPVAEKLPDGTVLIDKDGDPWKRLDGVWFILDGDSIPLRSFGPYAVAWLPKEDHDE